MTTKDKIMISGIIGVVLSFFGLILSMLIKSTILPFLSAITLSASFIICALILALGNKNSKAE